MLHTVAVLVRVLLIAGPAVAVPLASSPLWRRANSNACAEIGRAYDGAVLTTRQCMVYADKLAVRPSLAFDCLRSVPVDVDRDVALVKYLRPWLEFQSTIANIAWVATNSSGINSVEAMRERFEVPGKTGETGVPFRHVRLGFAPALAGYPEAFVIHEDRYQSGYLFNESALKDTAVLAVNLFLSPNQTGGEANLPSDVLADLLDFSRVSAEFVETSRKQGKSRLIIDLQGNGGGLVWNAMSLYATLFPDNSKAHMKMRVRAHPLLNWVGTMLGKMGVDIKTMPYPVGSSGFLDKDLKNFTDRSSFYGPEKIGENEYTNIIQPQDIDITPFAEADPPLAGLPTDGWTVNSANVYGDDDLATPAQFRYEAANCKLFYTWDTLTNMTSLWSAMAAVKWNRARCVKGSTTNDDGTMGTSTPGYSEKVLPGFVWAAGPGDVAGVPRSGGSNNHSAGTGDDDKNAAGSARASWGVMSIAVIITALVSVM